MSQNVQAPDRKKPSKLKIWLLVLLGLFMVLLVIGGGIVYWLYQSVNNTGEGVYGGPLPPGIYPIVGFETKPYRTVVLWDTQRKLMVMLVKNAQGGGAKAPFSTGDVDNQLQLFGNRRDIDDLRYQARGGTLSPLPLNKQIACMITYRDRQAAKNQLMVLNLDHGRLLVVATDMNAVKTKKTQKPTSPKPLQDFLSAMPVLTKDSHLQHPPRHNPPCEVDATGGKTSDPQDIPIPTGAPKGTMDPNLP